MPTDLITIYLVIGIISGILCSSVAMEKGLSAGMWFCNGLIFGIFALIAIAGMPDLVSRKYLRRLAEALPPVEAKGPKFDTSITS